MYVSVFSENLQSSFCIRVYYITNIWKYNFSVDDTIGQKQGHLGEVLIL